MSVDRTMAVDAVSGVDSRREVAADRRAPPVSASVCRFGTSSGAVVSWAGHFGLGRIDAPDLFSFSYFFFFFLFFSFPIFFHIFCTFHSNQFKPVPKLF
jgi:hypothetical protein